MTIAPVAAGQLIDPAWGNSVADQLNDLPLAIQHDATSVTLSSTGTAVITFPQTFTGTPSMPAPAVNGTGLYVAFISSIGATSFTVAVRRNDNGAALASTSVNIGWIAIGELA